MDDDKQRGITIITADNAEPAAKETIEDESMEGIPQWAQNLQNSINKLMEVKPAPAAPAPAKPSSNTSQIPTPPPAPVKEPEQAPVVKNVSIIGKIGKFLFS